MSIAEYLVLYHREKGWKTQSGDAWHAWNRVDMCTTASVRYQDLHNRIFELLFSVQSSNDRSSHYTDSSVFKVAFRPEGQLLHCILSFAD